MGFVLFANQHFKIYIIHFQYLIFLYDCIKIILYFLKTEIFILVSINYNYQLTFSVTLVQHYILYSIFLTFRFCSVDEVIIDWSFFYV